MSIRIAREGLNEAESRLKDEKIKGMLYELEAEIDEGDIDIRIVEFPGAIRTELSFNHNGYLIRREDQRADVEESLGAVIRSAIKRVQWLESKQALKEVDAAPIVRQKNLHLEPISREQAITEMKLVDHMFYMFKDAETGKICTIYARNNGGYGILMAD